MAQVQAFNAGTYLLCYLYVDGKVVVSKTSSKYPGYYDSTQPFPYGNTNLSTGSYKI